jgi:serine/threonine-protein kinase greatwall
LTEKSFPGSSDELEISINHNSKPNDDSKVSGVSPFFSAEDINVSVSFNNKSNKPTIHVDSISSYYTCNSSAEPSSSESNNNYVTASSNEAIEHKIEIAKENCLGFGNFRKDFSFSVSISGSPKNQQLILNFQMPPQKLCQFKLNEDSGISSRKSDTSNGRDESSSGQDKEENSCSDLSHSCNLSESNQSKGELTSPVRGLSRAFKRPDQKRGMKRRKHFHSRADSMCEDVNQSTGLTQEIDCIDIGSSTPKKRKSGSSPLKGVLKVK